MRDLLACSLRVVDLLAATQSSWPLGTTKLPFRGGTTRRQHSSRAEELVLHSGIKMLTRQESAEMIIQEQFERVVTS